MPPHALPTPASTPADLPMTSRIRPLARTARLAAAGLAGALLAGCAHTGDTLGYYWQSVRGHLQIMRAAEPVDDWIARPDTAAPLRARLELARKARAFAVTELHLPDNASYRRYADLGRRAAVWNVVAAPPDSLTLHTWCFPVTGCIGYRGYFAEGDARAEAARLAADGLETAVYGVPAYSTLGYTNWLGGDPLLNTFIGWPEGDFVRLLFHELAHQVVYANGDTTFNESFATAVERLGVARWLAERATPQARAEYALGEERRAAFRGLARATRERLADLYAREAGQPGLQEHKREAMEQFRARYAGLRAGWLAQGTQPAQIAGYDRWVAEANNAAFGAQAAYDELVPAFEALFQREGGEWPRFYRAVRRLAALPPDERLRELRAALPAPGVSGPPRAAD
ncbi:putative aminopeptidase [Paracidovorax citrulli]|uniref:Zinc protease protein n=3 Tax=Paracidovorax citrulli TaxID=80869 RepID=A1TK84_PARC0|nr:putative zinc protease protein [Paracidovorax citrulli AAC00-1]PVY65559.1 putative aminopeptidase [Paracidovorax citrulli]QCX11296.1 hypothetical protein APS58_2477 [Paracidovorax citrulli]REG70268.1 putative aminopeptidase [Paracidovorax citrulli]RLJ94820.1 putative aminopeptidase [Paracidovorax citrulli]